MSTVKPVKPAAGQLISANDLLTGAVVFLTPDNRWSADPADARIASDGDDAAAMLNHATSAAVSLQIVDAHLVDAAVDGNGPFPTRNREVIRALGPTVRPDLGYQAEGRPVLAEG